MSPSVEWPPGYFPIRLDREILEKTSELSSRPEEIICYPYLTSDEPVEPKTQLP